MVDGWHLLDRIFDEELLLTPWNIDQVVLLGRMMLQEVIILVGPILAVAITVSLVVNIIQVLTSLQDNTVSTVSRLLAPAARLFFMMPWMWRHLATTRLACFPIFTGTCNDRDSSA
jgi:flagellar biosynthesis protein FliQ